MKTIIFATAIIAILLLADTLVARRNSDALQQKFTSKLASLGIAANGVECAFDTGFPGSLKAADGYCTVQIPPSEIRDTLGRFGERQTDARVGGPWGKRSDSAGKCWKKLTVRDLPPALACAGSEDDVRVCLSPIFFTPDSGRMCLPLHSFDGSSVH